MDRTELAALWAHIAAMRVRKKDWDGAKRAVEASENYLFTEFLPEHWHKRGRARKEAETAIMRLTTVTK